MRLLKTAALKLLPVLKLMHCPLPPQVRLCCGKLRWADSCQDCIIREKGKLGKWLLAGTSWVESNCFFMFEKQCFSLNKGKSYVCKTCTTSTSLKQLQALCEIPMLLLMRGQNTRHLPRMNRRRGRKNLFTSRTYRCFRNNQNFSSAWGWIKCWCQAQTPRAIPNLWLGWLILLAHTNTHTLHPAKDGFISLCVPAQLWAGCVQMQLNCLLPCPETCPVLGAMLADARKVHGFWRLWGGAMRCLWSRDITAEQGWGALQ